MQSTPVEAGKWSKASAQGDEGVRWVEDPSQQGVQGQAFSGELGGDPSQQGEEQGIPLGRKTSAKDIAALDQEG